MQRGKVGEGGGEEGKRGREGRGRGEEGKNKTAEGRKKKGNSIEISLLHQSGTLSYIRCSTSKDAEAQK